MSKTACKAETRTVICAHCGKVFAAPSGHKNRKFCSQKCCSAAHPRSAYRTEKIPCKFQEGVECTDQKCETCGWNPEVQARRNAAVLEQYAED